jgi:hypothetical protein
MPEDRDDYNVSCREHEECDSERLRYDQSLPAATISTIRVRPCRSSSSNVDRTVESRSNTPIVRGEPLMETVRGMTISDFVSPSQASISITIVSPTRVPRSDGSKTPEEASLREEEGVSDGMGPRIRQL